MKLGARDAQQVQVVSGLTAGDAVVVEQSYLVKADIEKSGRRMIIDRCASGLRLPRPQARACDQFVHSSVKRFYVIHALTAQAITPATA